MRPTHLPQLTNPRVDIVLLGPVPPPYGGISNHVAQAVRLIAESGISVAVLNHFRGNVAPPVMKSLNRNPLNYYRLPRRYSPRIIHYHHSHLLNLVAVAASSFRSPACFIVTLHGSALRGYLQPQTLRHRLVKPLTLWALRRFDVVIAVDPRVAALVHAQTGLEVEVLPAFLALGSPVSVRYEPELEAFLRGGTVVVAAAYAVQFQRDGDETYGLDTVVEAFTRLAPTRNELRLALFIAQRPRSRKARRHLALLETTLANAGLTERVRILFGLPLLPAFRPNAVFVRATRAEGDAVSVREARQAGIRVVASDVVGRPDGVCTFPTGDAERLSAALRVVIGGDWCEAGARKASSSSDCGAAFASRLLEIYSAQLAASARPAACS